MSDDENETRNTTWAARLCTFIRARYLENGLIGEFEVGRTIGISTKALLVEISAGCDDSPEDIEDSQAGPAATALVRSTLASMMRASLSLPPYIDIVRKFSVSINPLGFNVGIGANVLLRATVVSLAAAEQRRLASLPPTAPPSSSATDADAAEPPKPPAWKPGHFIKKAMGTGDKPCSS